VSWPWPPQKDASDLFPGLRSTNPLCKLAERDQQLDTTTKVCEVLQRRLAELETALAVADANESERAEAQMELQAAQSAAAAAASAASGAEADSDGGMGSAISNGHLGPALLTLAGMPLHLLRLALPRVLMSPLGHLPMMRWLGRMVGLSPRPSLKRTRDDAWVFGYIFGKKP